jgi:hypothetical protein
MIPGINGQAFVPARYFGSLSILVQVGSSDSDDLHRLTAITAMRKGLLTGPMSDGEGNV